MPKQSEGRTMNGFDAFYRGRRRWEADSLAEWNARHPEEVRILGADGPECIEFSEDGDAYPHGIGGTGHVRRAATPWAESPHFVP